MGKNIELVSNLLNKFLAGDGQGYIDGCHDEFYGKIFSGLIPGGDEVCGKDDLKKMFDTLPKYMDIKKFEPVDWCEVDNNVYFTVNWEFLWKQKRYFKQRILLILKILAVFIIELSISYIFLIILLEL